MRFLRISSIFPVESLSEILFQIYMINIFLYAGYFFFPSCCQEFSIHPADEFVPSDFVTKHGFFFSDPVKHSLDGAFAARLVRAL